METRGGSAVAMVPNNALQPTSPLRGSALSFGVRHHEQTSWILQIKRLQNYSTVVTSNRRLDRDAFNQPTLQVARDLLGKFIVRSHQGRRVCAMITEVEAYKGPKDRASHAYGGRRTQRVEPLYGDGGTVYVYLVYGMHWLLNFSTAGQGNPEGILIRGILTDPAGEQKLVVGPGRVTQHLRINKRLDGADATGSKQIWLEDRGVRVPARCVRSGPRVGVDYAGPYWAARPWRFRIDFKPESRGSRLAFDIGGRVP